MAETPYLGVKKFSAEEPVDLNDINVNWDKIDAGVSQVKGEIDSINLIPGPEGPEGPTGPAGATGPTGPAGQAGRTIREGSGDPSSGVGVNGDFYIDKANWRIWGPKTSGSWSGTGPTSIAGPKGDAGPQGIQGPAGPAGPQGLQGSVGAKGSTGPQGPIGPTGTKGPKGDTGERGLQGPAGQAGPTGTAGPKGDPGEDAASIDNGLMAVDDVSLSWSQSTRRIEVTPTGDDFTFWVAGKKFTSEGDFLILPAGPALWWVYYSDDGELVSSTSRWDPEDACPIATVLISTDAPYSIVLDRRAAITMGATTREILLAGGSSVTSGLALSDSSYAIQPPAPVADDNEFGVDAGSIAVADRGFTILSMADGGPYDIFYRDGASWAWGRDQALPYLVGSTYLQADVDGVLTDLASGQYVNYWLITWPEISGEAPFGIIVGQTIHEYAEDAQVEKFSSLDLVGLDPDAVVPLWRITYEVSSAWNGVAGRSRIHSIMSHSTEVEAVRRSGDKMAGPLDLDGHPLSGLPAPEDPTAPLREGDRDRLVESHLHGREHGPSLRGWLAARADQSRPARVVLVSDSMGELSSGWAPVWRRMTAEAGGGTEGIWQGAWWHSFRSWTGTYDTSTAGIDGRGGAVTSASGVVGPDSAQPLAPNPPEIPSTLDIYYTASTSGGEVDVTIDGQVVGTFDTRLDENGAPVSADLPGQRWRSPTVGKAAWWSIEVIDSGTALIEGVVCPPAVPGIEVQGMGRSGQSTAQASPRVLAHIDAMVARGEAPDLVVLAADTAEGSSVSVPAVEAIVGQIRTVAPESSIVWMIPSGHANWGSSEAAQLAHADALRDAAHSLGVPVIDLFAAMGPIWAGHDPHEFSADTVHHTAKGVAAACDVFSDVLASRTMRPDARIPDAIEAANQGIEDAETARQLAEDALPKAGGTLTGQVVGASLAGQPSFRGVHSIGSHGGGVAVRMEGYSYDSIRLGHLFGTPQIGFFHPVDGSVLSAILGMEGGSVHLEPRLSLGAASDPAAPDGGVVVWLRTNGELCYRTAGGQVRVLGSATSDPLLKAGGTLTGQVVGASLAGQPSLRAIHPVTSTAGGIGVRVEGQPYDSITLGHLFGMPTIGFYSPADRSVLSSILGMEGALRISPRFSLGTSSDPAAPADGVVVWLRTNGELCYRTAGGEVQVLGSATSGPLQLDAAGDMLMPDSVVADGMVEGGVLRRVQSGLSIGRYTQTSPPIDGAVHPGWRVLWDAEIADTDLGWGPSYGTWIDPANTFGPPGVYNIEGEVRWGQDSSFLSLTPIGYADLLGITNTAGADRVLVPSWIFLAARRIQASDGRKITLNHNDHNRGGASFASNHLWLAADFSDPENPVPAGEIDGDTNNVWMISFFGGDFVGGNVSIPGRVVLDVNDLNDGELGPEHGQNNLVGAVVAQQIGVRIPRMIQGVRNIGIQNGSATVESPHSIVVADGSVTIADPDSDRPGMTTMLLDAPAPVTMTAVPQLQAGSDGQRLSVASVGDPVTLHDGDGLALSAPTLTLDQGDAVSLVYSDDAGAWVEVASAAAKNALPANNAAGTLSGGRTALGVLSVGMEFVHTSHTDAVVGMARGSMAGIVEGGAILLGGGSGEYDTLLTRVAAGELRVASATGHAILKGIAPPSGYDSSEATSVASASGGYTESIPGSFPLGFAHCGKTLLASSTSTVTISTGISTENEAWPVGASCRVVQTGTDPVTVAVAGGQTLLAPHGAASTIQGQEGTIRRLSSTEWSINWL